MNALRARKSSRFQRTVTNSLRVLSVFMIWIASQVPAVSVRSAVLNYRGGREGGREGGSKQASKQASKEGGSKQGKKEF